MGGAAERMLAGRVREGAVEGGVDLKAGDEQWMHRVMAIARVGRSWRIGCWIPWGTFNNGHSCPAPGSHHAFWVSRPKGHDSSPTVRVDLCVNGTWAKAEEPLGLKHEIAQHDSKRESWYLHTRSAAIRQALVAVLQNSDQQIPGAAKLC